MSIVLCGRGGNFDLRPRNGMTADESFGHLKYFSDINPYGLWIPPTTYPFPFGKPIAYPSGCLRFALPYT
jgi:hypothetical protein